jgi:hypothetical protein
LTALDLARRFAFICGQDTFGVKKTRSCNIAAAIERCRRQDRGRGHDRRLPPPISIRRALAGVPFIAVDFGYTDIPVAEMKPDLIISHFDALSGGRGRAATERLRRRRGYRPPAITGRIRSSMPGLGAAFCTACSPEPPKKPL